jgi:hypothetical protein
VEGHSITRNAPEAHTIKCHVGPVAGKSSFKNKQMFVDVYDKAKKIIKSNKLKNKIKVERSFEDLKDEKGTREITHVRVDKFNGFDDGKPRRNFKYITIIRDKPHGSNDDYLLQTVYPSEGSRKK